MRPPNPVFVIVPAGQYLFRIFDPTSFGTGPLPFRSYGPLRRFDHHEGTRRGHGRQPAMSQVRRILYTATSLSCCIVEIFGDTGLIRFGAWHVATPFLTRPLRLLDLRGSAAMRAGSVAALTQAPDHRLGQTWSRFFYEEAIYQSVDGLLYASAHNGEDTIALYERAESGLACAAHDVLPLSDLSLRPTLIDIGRRNHFIVAIAP